MNSVTEKRTVQDITYTLIFCRRKSIGIQITRTSDIVVRAPLKIPAAFIDTFVLEKRNWIKQKQSQLLQQLQDMESAEKVPIQELPFLGRLYPVVTGIRPHFNGTTFFLPELLLSQNHPYLKQLYTNLAKEYILPRCQNIAARVGLQPTAIKISHAKSRWGSCSGKNSLNFSYMLISAPPECVDYVIIHELCHIKYHNHSPSFWKLVESFIPQWQSCHNTLQKHILTYGCYFI